MSGIVMPKLATQLDVDQLRYLVRWCNDQAESWWLPNNRGRPLGTGQILALWHAARAAGYSDMDGWSSDSSDAVAAWLKVRR